MARRIGGEDVRLYVPRPLPPEPALALGPEDIDRLERANRALGRLDALSHLPNPDLFLYIFVRKEAVLSSQIEGTQSSLADLLLFEADEAPGVPLDDVREVIRCVAAMITGLKGLRGDFPLSLRLLRDMHEELLANAAGPARSPGSSAVPKLDRRQPAGQRLFRSTAARDSSSAWAPRKIHPRRSRKTPTLIKAALVHVQFETIHPFLDGNGRLGRLLITLILCNEGALRQPLLYLSLYFKQNRARYYELLQRVRTTGDWESWIRFFLEGVEQTAGQAVNLATKVRELFARDRARIAKLGRVAGSALRVHELLQAHPLISVPKATKLLTLTPPTVRASLTALGELGIVKEVSGRHRDRVFGYRRYLDLIASDTNA